MLSFNVTAGTLLNTYSANKAVYVQTNSAGQVVINFGITATPTIYVMVQAGGQPVPSIGTVLPANYS
jgi:thioredoxin-like negative regulator of GroEL